MKRPARPNHFPGRILVLALALAWFFPADGRAWAQDRWLLIFDNSAAMKKRLPAVGLELQKLFFTSMAGEMHTGDSLGVWTFDQTLHVGEFPLSTWQPELAANTATNLFAFLNKRNYKGEANFNALQPVLGEVVTKSHRLTVLIFCEGQGEVIWTPYNFGINQTMRQNYAERKKNNQPFVIVLRAQDGKYFGCSVNFPPGSVNFPTFPPGPPAEPLEVKAEPATTALMATETPGKKNVPLDNTPLVIVGKSGGTNLTSPPPTPPKSSPNAAPVSARQSASNNLSAGTMAANASTPTVAPVSASNSPATENAMPVNALPVAAGKPAADNGYKILILTGVLALVCALALVIFLAARARQPRGSLITDSMNAPRLPPPKK